MGTCAAYAEKAHSRVGGTDFPPVLRTPRPRLFFRSNGHDVRNLHGGHPHRAHPSTSSSTVTSLRLGLPVTLGLFALTCLANYVILRLFKLIGSQQFRANAPVFQESMLRDALDIEAVLEEALEIGYSRGHGFRVAGPASVAVPILYGRGVVGTISLASMHDAAWESVEGRIASRMKELIALR